MNFFQSLSLKSRILLIVTLACVICSTTAMSLALYFNKQELYRGVIDKSNAIHLRLDAAKDYVSTQGGLEPVIERMRKKYNKKTTI